MVKQLKLINDFYYCRLGKGALSYNTCLCWNGNPGNGNLHRDQVLLPLKHVEADVEVRRYSFVILSVIAVFSDGALYSATVTTDTR